MGEKTENKPLSKYLEGIKSYVGYGPDHGLQDFIKELFKIEKVEERFEELLKDQPEWAKLAEISPPQFLLDKTGGSGSNGNDVQLYIFENGKIPVIKVMCHN